MRGNGLELCLVAAALATVAAAATPPAAAAQGAERPGLMPQWEVRLDATSARAPAVHAGAGLNVRAGLYARVGLAAALGGARATDDRWDVSQRLDLTVRFLLDPFDERRFGLYGGAGVGARRDGSDQVVGSLLLVAGVEGGGTRGPRLAVELGLGGGARLGVVLRGRRAGQTR
ncbi:MAG: hypothetical protein WD771_04350 [Gemmatimonadaceae bacterium]